MSDSRGFRLDVVEPSWYPARRTKRAGAPVELGELAVQAPRTRVFPWDMSVTANSRRSLSMGRWVGPAVAKHLAINAGFGIDAPSCTVELGFSSVSVTESGVSLATPRPYTTLTELVNPFGHVSAPSGSGFLATSLGTLVRHSPIPLDLVLNQPEGYLVLAVVNNSGSGGTFNGHVILIEGIDPQAIRFFL